MAATLKNGVASAAAGAAGGAATGAASDAIGGLLGKVTGGAGSAVSTAAGGFLGNLQECQRWKWADASLSNQRHHEGSQVIPDVGGVAAGMLKSQLGCFGGGGAQARLHRSTTAESEQSYGCYWRAIQEEKAVAIPRSPVCRALWS